MPMTEFIYRCDRCKSAFAPLVSWPTHPRQGYAYCMYCGDVVTKYFRDGFDVMSQAEPTEPYVYQPDPAKSLEDKAWAISGPGADDYKGKRFTKAEAELELKRLMTRLCLNLLDMARRCEKCGRTMAHYRVGGWKCLRGC